MTVNYQRPVEAKLHVHLADGQSWPATDTDLNKFGLVDGLLAYGRFDEHLTNVLSSASLIENDDLTGAKLNPLRWLAEMAIRYPEFMSAPDQLKTDEQIVNIERSLQNSRRIITSVDELEELPVASAAVSAADLIWQKNTTQSWYSRDWTGAAVMDSTELLLFSGNKLFLIHRPLTEAS